MSGQRSVGVVYASVYGGDVLLNTALALYEPTEWSAKELAIDMVDKFVQAEATGLIFDRLRSG